MLKGLDPLLNADVLHTLRAMGHGDALVIADTNFPAHACAAQTVRGEPLRIDADAATAVRAVMSVMPLDTFIDDSARRMEVVGDASMVPDVQREVAAVLNEAEGREVAWTGTERFDFYERAKNAFAVLQTDERRFYGCFLLVKGVVSPDG